MATPPLDEIRRRVLERDTTLDLPAIVVDLIESIGVKETKAAELRNNIAAGRREIEDRDQRIQALQVIITRQNAVIEVLRERMQTDLASHRLAQVVLEAFDGGAMVIPTIT